MNGKMDKAIAELDAIHAGDPEGAHGAADKILLAYVPKPVKAAYERVVERADWWSCA